ncbi:MAG: secretin N-terminal domain-containing protein [Candidatus Aceula meridiana]|nr:secretin N-terminal domain-containing protein [Candidatus Aceula meridiana]
MKKILMLCFIVGLGIFWCSAGGAQTSGQTSSVDNALDLFDQDEQAIIKEALGEPVAAPEPIVEPVAMSVSEPAAEKELVATKQQRTGPISKEQQGTASSSVREVGGRLVLDVLELKDMDIVDVLKLISKKSGLNIVAGANVRGKVTIYLKNVDVRDALRIILEANGLAFVEENDIIKVLTGNDFETRYGYQFGRQTETRIVQLKNASAADLVAALNQMKNSTGSVVADANSNTVIMTDQIDKIIMMENFAHHADIPIASEIFTLKYSKAEEVAKKIEGTLTKGISQIEWDERSNKIIVTDTSEKIKEISKLVEAFDEKQSQVLIEAKIIQVVLSDTFKFGVDWEAIVRDYHTLTLNSAFNVISDTDKSGTLSIGTIDDDDYDVLIEALETVGDTNTLSSPRILAINNEEAKILVGSNEPYITSETITTASGPATTSESVNFIDVGVKLYVTPKIHGDGYVTLKIKPEVSSVTRYLTTSTNNEIPIVDTSQAETTVTIKDGVTIVLGGLIKDEDIDNVNKVPLLGDIPFLGAVFRNKSQTTRKTELVIFLTCHIVGGDVDVEPKTTFIE